MGHDIQAIQKQIEPVERDAKEAIELLESMPIDSDEMADTYSEIMNDSHQKIKELEKERKKITDPINAGLKAVNALFKKPKEPLQRLKDFTKAGLTEWLHKKELAKADAISKKDVKQIEKLQKTEVDSMTTVTYWDYEIKNFDEIPRDYLCLDHSKVKIELRGADNPEKYRIPGLSFVQRTRVQPKRSK